ncbi:hypothetical protein A2141_02545 [Candidatus Woesebacteria bacterium RBG_16_40_11]|uniref:Uncharacterized protein n=1 Tax=Candidatus Woesebacteria bacterium RIFCSPHIGHO2_01_FULL_40_22 TaxID=1802499 RepID=A0A1F7YHU7_9BACT|nr:MAG: hypothetical protein A2141_02545 [Candidatus Woesebacteria bacterium RBG_16_40_11]OGM26924.1 MAG: hypothetical protein A2628_05790 [Candidatus Woesebacteria bacterium RIFCSPHIGHO2_01_FULL_40_22]
MSNGNHPSGYSHRVARISKRINEGYPVRESSRDYNPSSRSPEQQEWILGYCTHSPETCGCREHNSGRCNSVGRIIKCDLIPKSYLEQEPRLIPIKGGSVEIER